PVYFYNGNGETLSTETTEKGKMFGAVKKPDASLTGYAFDKWSVSDDTVINNIVRAVALFKDSNKTFTVKAGGTTVASGVKYGESVTVNGSADFSCWKLGDKVMSYEKNYTFNVYGNITLTEVTGTEMKKTPVLVLDKSGDEYFLTYDAGEYELVEAGILFGSNGVSIGSIDGYKASARKGTGQFTAKPHAGAADGTIARGYMVCKDGSTFKVVYAD
ncbi:MAG: hypothetical protein IKU43_09975, partial [Clostridia bacterium]|nr:hypothetical protein [Clostridia bacterium]